MFDIDPPSPVLHLSSPQAGTQPTLRANAQHLAQHTQSKPRVRIAEGIAAHWARLHTARTGLRSLAEADGTLAHHIGAL